MISEQDKKEIFNGTLARTKNNKKAKFMFKSDHKANVSHPYLFIISDKDKCYPDWYNEHLNSKQDKSNSSIVELWKDEPEPFILEKALAGLPVKTRDGCMAYVQAMINQPKELSHYTLIGYGFNGIHKEFLSWDKNGKATKMDTSCDDIIGMWRDSQSEPKTVTLTLPCPLKDPREIMWFINDDFDVAEEEFDGHFSEMLIEGRYFATKEDAQAWLDAMKNNRR